MKNKFLNKTKKRLGNTLWVVCLLLGIESFTFKQSYPTLVGIMLIMISFVFLPWKNKILNKHNIKLTMKQNILIIVGCFVSIVISFRFINNQIGNWIWCFISFVMMLLVYTLVIFYSKRKNKISR